MINMPMWWILVETVCLFLAVAGLVGGQDTVNTNIPGALQGSCYCLHEVTSGLRNPVSATFVKKGGEELIIVVEQRGVASVYSMNGEKQNTFADLSDRVVTSKQYGESRGLLSLVLDPSYDVTGKAFAYYIREVEGAEYAYVSQFHTSGSQLDPETETFLLRIYQPFIIGNGGPMLFGDDGYLYIMTGDGGEEDDLSGKAQNMNSFHGKVLRIDVTSGQEFLRGESGVAKTYSVPATNPFWNVSGAREEVFAFGIRNMWGCSVDSSSRGGDGQIYCAETGTDQFDEINVILSGRNYGWNIKEGQACLNASSSCGPLENEALPFHEFAHNASHSLVGGYVYRGELFPNLSGVYTFGDVITGETYLLEESRDRVQWSMCDVKKCPGNAKARRLRHLLAFAQDLSGELYLLMTDNLLVNNPEGKMYRIIPPSYSDSLRVTLELSVPGLCVALWAVVIARVF